MCALGNQENNHYFPLLYLSCNCVTRRSLTSFVFTFHNQILTVFIMEGDQERMIFAIFLWSYGSYGSFDYCPNNVGIEAQQIEFFNCNEQNKKKGQTSSFSISSNFFCKLLIFFWICSCGVMAAFGKFIAATGVLGVPAPFAFVTVEFCDGVLFFFCFISTGHQPTGYFAPPLCCPRTSRCNLLKDQCTAARTLLRHTCTLHSNFGCSSWGTQLKY